MKKEEEDILKKCVENQGGLLSPASVINSFSKGNRGIPEKLVSLGYLELVPEEIHTGETINFYRVTEKGFAFFYPLHKKAWFYFKVDLRTILVAVIISVVTSIITLFLFK